SAASRRSKIMASVKGGCERQSCQRLWARSPFKPAAPEPPMPRRLARRSVNVAALCQSGDWKISASIALLWKEDLENNGWATELNRLPTVPRWILIFLAPSLG